MGSQVGSAVFSALGLTRPKSSCWLVRLPSGGLGRIHFQIQLTLEQQAWTACVHLQVDIFQQ